MTDESNSTEVWDRARDEALDEMAGQQSYEWADIQAAIDEIVRRWRYYEIGNLREQPDPIAYLCEVEGEGGWHDYIGREHPSETFEHLEYRNVRPLVEVDDE